MSDLVAQASVRHRDAVLNFSADDSGKLFYRILDTSQPHQENTADDERWTDPVSLSLPIEVRDLGLTLLTVETDEVTTAAQTAVGTDIQALSDGDFVYLFRQSAAGSLLMNRFVMATTTVTPDSSEDSAGVDQSGATSEADNNQSRIQELQSVWELRYVQSGRKDAPAGPKDTLSYTDALGEPFIEPTIQLGMIQHLANGAFAVALTPTGKPDRDVWQFFAFDDSAKKLNLFTIPRSGSGLFDLSDSSWTPTWSVPITIGAGENAVAQTIPSGMSAVVYSQQEEIPTDSGQSVPVKRRIRLMLAAAIRADGDSGPANGDPLGVVDFAVSIDGELPPVEKLELTSIPQTGSMLDLSPNNSLPDGTLLGGLLTEATTKSAPQLLDSADGLVHAYYADGSSSKLSVAEYSTTTARAQIKVPIGDGELLFPARRPGTGMVTASVKIEPELDASDEVIKGFCKVTLASGPGTTADVETWRMVPTDTQQLATVINGEAVFLPFEDSNVQLGQKVFYDYTGGTSQGMRAIYSAPADYGAVWFLARPPAISVDLQETSVTLTEEKSPADMPLCTIDLKLTRRRPLNPQGGWTTYNGYAAAANPKISAIASDDANGQMYFADYDNGLIVLDVESGVWSVAGFGFPDPTDYHPTCISVDRSGQVWMGSNQSPLFTYFDGQNSWGRQFNTDHLTGGTGTTVGGFAVDGNGVLWLVAQDLDAQDQKGSVYFLKFDPTNSSFAKVADYSTDVVDSSEPNVVSVWAADDGIAVYEIFVGTQAGIAQLDVDSNSTGPDDGWIHNPALSAGERFTAVVQDRPSPDSAIDAATNVGNFYSINPGTGISTSTMTGPFLGLGSELLGGQVNALLRSADDSTIAFTTQSTPGGAGGSIGQFTNLNSQVIGGGTTGDPSLPAVALGLDTTDSEEPKLWAYVWDTSSTAAAGGGFLIRYNYATGQQTKFSGSKLPHGNVLSISRDATGAMWVGTSHGGLVKIDAGAATTISNNVTAADDVHALTENPSKFTGGVWAGSALSGARLFPATAEESFQPTVVINSTSGLGSNDVRSLAADDDGRLWVGTKNAGLYRATWDGTAVSNVSKVAAVDVDDIRTVAIDHEGDAWVGTNAGVYRIDSSGELVTKLTHQDGLVANDVQGIAVGLAGDMWIATNGGLSHVRDTGVVIENITESDGLASYWLNCVAVDPDGNVWVGTQGDGVTKYPPLHPELIVTYTPADGLVDDIVLAVGSTLAGEMFFGTNRGLSTFTPSEPLTFTERWPHVPRSPAEMLSVLAGTAHGNESPFYRYNYGAASSSLPNADLSAGSFLFSATDAGAVEALTSGVTASPGLIKADGVEITQTVPQGASRLGGSSLFRVLAQNVPNDQQLFSFADTTPLEGALQNQSELIDNAWRIGISDQASLQFNASGGSVSIKSQKRLDLSDDISLQSWVRPAKPVSVATSGEALKTSDFSRVIHRNNGDQKMFLAVGPADYGLQLNPGNPPDPYVNGDGSFLQLDSMQTPLDEMAIELWLMFNSLTSWDGSRIQTILCKLDDDGNRFLHV